MKALLALAALVSCFGLASAEEPAAASHRDVRVQLEIPIWDPTADLWLPPVQLAATGVEWRDGEGEWHLELVDGAAQARGLRDGEVDVPLVPRFEIYDRARVVSEADGVRRYALRGELYLRSPEWELVELDLGFALGLPTEDGTFEGGALPSLPTVGAERFDELVAAQVDQLIDEGRGGAGLTELASPLWGRPHGARPFYGVIRLVRSSAAASARAPAALDADRLLGRLLYVRSDYPQAVADGGVVLDEAEFEEQTRLLQEARVIASRLPLSEATVSALHELGSAGSGMVSPSAFGDLATRVIGSVRGDLWLALSAPRGDALDQGAALYSTHCAACHGEGGLGPPAAMAALNPQPPTFAGGVPGLAPQRAFNAVTFGVPGTAMAAFGAALDEAQRWALAFYVVGLGAGPSTQVGAPLTLEELATSADADLCVGCAGWSRHDGTRAAAASPWLDLRLHVRAAARAEGDLTSAEVLWRDLRRRLRRLDARLAARLNDALRSLRGASADEVSAAAPTLLIDLSAAERLERAR